MKCPKCGSELERNDDNKYVCPNCHAKFAAKSAGKPAETKATAPADENNQSAVEAANSSYEQATQPATDTQEEQNTQFAAENQSEQPAPLESYYQGEQDAPNANDDLGEQPAPLESYDQGEQYSAQVFPEAEQEQPSDGGIDLSQYEIPSFEYSAPTPAQPAKSLKASDIRASARPLFKKNFGYCILTDILLMLVQFGSLLSLTIFGPLLIGGAIQSGYAGFFIDVANDKCEGTQSTYRGFNNFMPALWLNLLCALMYLVPIIFYIIVVAICSILHPIVATVLGLLLGIALIFAFAFLSSVTQYAFYGLNAGISKKATELINYAFKLASKNFGKILCLKLSFIGWWLLCILTWGILTIYVVPYYKTSLAKQYLVFVEAEGQTPAPAQEMTATEA